MDYEVTKMGTFHKMNLVCDSYEIRYALAKLCKFKCYSSAKDLEFSFYMQKLDLHIPLTMDTLLQMDDESEHLLEYRFFTYNDATRIFVSINHQ